LSKGKLIAISAASGAGKTTICNELLKRNNWLNISISATSRPIRGTEKDGKEYFFLSKKQFEQKIKNNDFVEWEEVHGHYYGTLHEQVDQNLENGKSVLLDIDVLGALNIKKKFPNSVLLFIKAPSIEILKKRLTDRKTESEKDIKKRLERVEFENEQANHFDHVIINDTIETTINEIESLIKES
jgi:guanylate kinase